MQTFPGEQSCLILQISPRRFSEACFHKCADVVYLIFYEPALPERLPVKKITQTGPSTDACQLRAKGPTCVFREGHNCSLRQPFSVSFLPNWGPCVHAQLTVLIFSTSHFIAWMLASNSVHCIFSCAPTVLSWKLDGHRP